MDLVKAFHPGGDAACFRLSIRGSPQDPLFPAGEVGELLGLTNIRASIKDFDDDEMVAGDEGVLFLTELGLFRLLGMSRKPVARAFQKWVAKVVKEIREAAARQLLEAREAEARQLLEAREAAARQLLEAKETELHRYRKTFDPVPREEIVYVNKEVSELSSDRHKIGITIDEKKRQCSLNTGSAQGSKMIFTLLTNNAKLVETQAAAYLKRYHCGREHYNCNVEHSIKVLKVSAAVADTLASMHEHITCKEMKEHLVAAVTAAVRNEAESETDAESDCETGSESDSDSESRERKTPEYLARLDMVNAWLDRVVNFAPVRDAKRHHGRHYFAYLPAHEMLVRMMSDLNLGDRGKAPWKALLAHAMQARGRRISTMRPRSLETNKVLRIRGYNRVCWKA